VRQALAQHFSFSQTSVPAANFTASGKLQQRFASPEEAF